MSKIHITLNSFIKENMDNEPEMDNELTPIQKVNFDGEELNIFLLDDVPMKGYIYAEDSEGEPYYDISVILPDNLLIDAFWVKKGEAEEKIANMLDFIEAAGRTTTSGFNIYALYTLKH